MAESDEIRGPVQYAKYERGSPMIPDNPPPPEAAVSKTTFECAWTWSQFLIGCSWTR